MTVGKAFILSLDLEQSGTYGPPDMVAIVKVMLDRGNIVLTFYHWQEWRSYSLLSGHRPVAEEVRLLAYSI